MEQEILNTIKDVLKKDGHHKIDSITMNSKFEELELDSLGGLMLISELEEKYGITIESEEVFTVTSLRDIIQIIKRLIETK